MTIPSLVLSGRSSPVMTTWLDVMRRADAIDHHGTDPDRVLLTEARDLMTRLLHMADVLDRLSDRPPEPRNTHALKRRRWFVSTKRPQEVASVCDILESDGTESVRRIELRDGVRPAAMSIRCRPTEAMLPFDSDASHIGPALREAASLMRTSLAHLSDPRAPDPLVVPDLIQDAAAAVVMRLGDADPCDDPDVVRIAALHARSPWRDAFLTNPLERGARLHSDDADVIPTMHAASVRYENAPQKGDDRRAAHMLIEPWSTTLSWDVKDPIARLRHLNALEILRGRDPRERA